MAQPLPLMEDFRSIFFETVMLQRFQKTVWDCYHAHRRSLPWRKMRNPYRILVSEVMLQQTQVDRVLIKYPQFIEAFPNFSALARASLRAVLKVWQGMGYNRRALFLQNIAKRVVKEYKGELPDDAAVLKTFPGIGEATACSIAAFAFNKPVAFIETNIRAVFIHHFFRERKRVHDREILPLVKQTLNRKNPREWYSALMDYGSMLKKMYGNANRKSAHYVRQSPFKGSNREMRGALLRLLMDTGKLNVGQVIKQIPREPKVVIYNLVNLQKEGFLVKDGDEVMIN